MTLLRRFLTITFIDRITVGCGDMRNYDCNCNCSDSKLLSTVAWGWILMPCAELLKNFMLTGENIICDEVVKCVLINIGGGRRLLTRFSQWSNTPKGLPKMPMRRLSINAKMQSWGT